MDQLINYIKYFILGLIQGITEPLPVSSSAHVLFFGSLMKINNIDISLEIILHFASTLAIIIFMLPAIIKLFKGVISNDKKSLLNRKYLLYLIIASIPIGIGGLLLKDLIDEYFITLLPTVIFLVITSLMLLCLGIMLNKQVDKRNDITLKDSIIIGLFQLTAIFPGISRSGATLFGGVSQKINLKTSLQFSFFLYLIVSISSFILTILDNNIFTTDLTNNLCLIVSFIGSFIATWFSIRFFYQRLNAKMCFFFSAYCLVVVIINIIRF